jgi:AcrR family transcriptional regulator
VVRVVRRSRTPDRDLRDSILSATRGLLDERPFDQIAVADILDKAGISRGSFYFYFESKHDVLAELVRRAIAEGHSSARSWLGHSAAADDERRREATRRSIADGARLWGEQAPVLRAIVENWRTDPTLTELWLEQMAGFTRVTADRIDADRAAGAIAPQSIDSATLAAALTWLGERLYYLAALGLPPFDDQEKLVDVLTHIWMAALYAPNTSRRP